MHINTLLYRNHLKVIEEGIVMHSTGSVDCGAREVWV